jgi:hypothetical protein
MTISQYTPVTTASAKASAKAGVIVTPALVTPCGRLRTARVKASLAVRRDSRMRIMLLPSRFHFTITL